VPAKGECTDLAGIVEVDWSANPETANVLLQKGWVLLAVNANPYMLLGRRKEKGP